MKKLLLTSALVAVAGAAAAEITWTGEATLEWRSHYDSYTTINGYGYALEDDTNGLTFDASLDASGSAELDNGITATITYGLDIEAYNIYDGIGGYETEMFVTADAFPTLTLESSVATLTVGDTEMSYYTVFDDYYIAENDGDDLLATLDTTYGPAKIGVSYVIDGDYAFNGLATDMYSVTAEGNINGVKAAVGYVGGNSDYRGDIFGLLIGYELNGIDVALKYQHQAESDEFYNPFFAYDYVAYGESIGNLESSLIEADFAYTMQNGISLGLELDHFTYDDFDAIFGYEVSAGFEAMGADITLSYGDENTDDDIDGNFAIDASYEVLPGLTVLAGYDMGEYSELEADWDNADSLEDLEGGYYVGTEYDLGGGASVYASYANYEDAGDEDYNAGATLGLALTF